ncbi:ankyrin repeat-containing [Fusarium albosuccineum]|uniref:Ankyrin repeat-containing n=1 Tax=Fusarium albosuccineum TaxID=1237068 RepID=A0A8H4LHR6_9HYPO|nr:ankyrin repeat-containing [Fusarium albosuccineum]
MPATPGKAPLESAPEEVFALIINAMDTYKQVHTLVLCSRTLYKRAEPLLYIRDVRKGGLNSMKQAASTMENHAAIAAVNKLMLRIEPSERVDAINASFKHKNGYATVLHIAAALGKVDLFFRLVQLGANKLAGAKNLGAIIDFDHRYVGENHQELTSLLSRTIWMPNLVPLLKNKMTLFLLFQGDVPTSVMALPERGQAPGRGVTLFHLAVVLDDERLLRTSFRFWAQEKDFQSASGGYSALHLAIKTTNEPLFQFLLDRDPRTDIYDDSGRGALHLAIEASCMSVESSVRNWMCTVVIRLLLHGVSPLQRKNTRHQENPYFCLSEYFQYEWTESYRSIRTIISSLRHHERQLNVSLGRDPASTEFNLGFKQGLTVLSRLAKAIIKNSPHGNVSQEKFFFDLVRMFGADLNLDVRDQGFGRQPSILAQVLKAQGLRRFDKALVKAGATIRRDEAPDMLELWQTYDR